jgi:hypothetical protein
MLYLRRLSVLHDGESSQSFPEEAIMAEESKDSRSPKADEPKKQPETVLLSAEELRSIAGGMGTPSGPPPIIQQNPNNPQPPTG